MLYRIFHSPAAPALHIVSEFSNDVSSYRRSKFEGIYESFYEPSCVVAGLPVRTDQLVHLSGRQSVGHRLGVLGEYRLELLRNKPAMVN